MMSSNLGLKSPLHVIERVLQKVTLLIEKWPSHPQILDKNLGPSGLFRSLVSGMINEDPADEYRMGFK